MKNQKYKLIKEYEGRGDFEAAAKIAEEIGDKKLAMKLNMKEIELWQKRGDFHGAAEFAIKVGEIKKAKELYKKGLKYYEKKFARCLLDNSTMIDDTYSMMVDLAEKLGDTQQIRNLYENVIKKAENCSKEKGMLIWPVVANFAEAMGDIEKAIKFNEKSGMFYDAAELAERLGDAKQANKLYEKAIKDYERMKWFDNAGYVAEKLGDAERSKKLFIKAMKHYEKRANSETEKCFLFCKAGRFAEKVGNKEKAKEYYEKSIEEYKREDHSIASDVADEISKKIS